MLKQAGIYEYAFTYKNTYEILAVSVLCGNHQNTPVWLSKVAPGGRVVSKVKVMGSSSGSDTFTIKDLFCPTVMFHVDWT